SGSLVDQRTRQGRFLANQVKESELSQESIIRRSKLHCPLDFGVGVFIAPKRQQGDGQPPVGLAVISFERKLFPVESNSPLVVAGSASQIAQIQIGELVPRIQIEGPLELGHRVIQPQAYQVGGAQAVVRPM